MSPNPESKSRRKLLIKTVGLIGGLGIAGTAYPLVRSMSPSAKALAEGANVTVDISKLQPGQMIVTEWRKLPVWILRRTPEMLADLPFIQSQTERSGFRTHYATTGLCTQYPPLN